MSINKTLPQYTQNINQYICINTNINYNITSQTNTLNPSSHYHILPLSFLH